MITTLFSVPNYNGEKKVSVEAANLLISCTYTRLQRCKVQSKYWCLPKYFHCAYSSVYYSPSYSTFCYIALATLHAKYTSIRPEVSVQNWISSQNLKKKNVVVVLCCITMGLNFSDSDHLPEMLWAASLMCYSTALMLQTGTDNYQLILVPYH